MHYMVEHNDDPLVNEDRLVYPRAVIVTSNFFRVVKSNSTSNRNNFAVIEDLVKFLRYEG